MLSHGDTPICQKLACLCQEQRHHARLKSMVKISFWCWGQRSRSYRVHECTWPIVPWWYTHVPNNLKGQKIWGLNTKSCHKPYKFDLEVKGQRHIRIMNELITSSHGNRPMCQNMPMSKLTDMKTWHDKNLLRARITNGEIGPVPCQNCETWNCQIFVT